MLVNEEKVKVEGNIPFAKKVEMTLDPSAVAMHIRNMIRMYENPRLAALREYTSNARDAHQAAGYKGPVEVTLPTSLHPFLTVKDHGIGLDSEEIEGFGQFGRSTKNNSNEYIGGFGLGSKSGLAVANQFTVIAVKDGRKNVVIVGRDEENHPTLGFTAEQDTDEGNGVTIQIPSATHHDDWVNIATGKMFLGWEPGSIIINGKEPSKSVHNTAQYKALDGGWLSLADRPRWYGADHVDALVHGVYYRIPTRHLPGNTARVLWDSVLQIDNGSVDILPSRDNLEWTDRTIRAVREAAEKLAESIRQEYAAQLTQVKTFREAKQVEYNMEEVGLPVQGLTWNNVPLSWKRIGKDVSVTVASATTSSTSKSGYQSSRTASNIVRESDVWQEHSILVTHATGTAKASYYKKDMRFHTESSDVTAFAVAEAAKMGLADPTQIKVYLTESATPKKDLAEGFVLAMEKVITVADFVNQAKEQRAKWAKDRATNATPRAPRVDRELRVIWGFDRYSGRLSTGSRYESVLIADQPTVPIVVLHPGDPLAKQVLDTHADYGTLTQNMKNLMALLGKEARSSVNFVMMARNHKVENLNITGYLELSDWVRAELRKVQVRTPMQIRAEQIRSKNGWGDSIPALLPDHIKQIKNPQMREFYEAYTNPIDDGVLGAAALAFPDHAVKQPVASTFHPTQEYPLLSMVSAHRNPQALVDYINLVDAARAQGITY